MINLISLRRSFFLSAVIVACLLGQLSASSYPEYDRFEDLQDRLLSIRIRSFEELSPKEQHEFLS